MADTHKRAMRRDRLLLRRVRGLVNTKRATIDNDAIIILSRRFGCVSSQRTVATTILKRFDTKISSAELCDTFIIHLTFIDRKTCPITREYSIINSQSLSFGAILAYLNICNSYGCLL